LDDFLEVVLEKEGAGPGEGGQAKGPYKPVAKAP